MLLCAETGVAVQVLKTKYSVQYKGKPTLDVSIHVLRTVHRAYINAERKHRRRYACVTVCLPCTFFIMMCSDVYHNFNITTVKVRKCIFCRMLSILILMLKVQ